MKRKEGSSLALVSRLVAFTLAAFLAATQPIAAETLSNSDLQLYKKAFKAAAKKDWVQAKSLSRRAKSKLPAEIIEWQQAKTTNSGADFVAINRFLTDIDTWPHRTTLQRQAEAQIGTSLTPDQAIQWLTQHKPLTPDGISLLANILEDKGKADAARLLVREAWRDMDMYAADERNFRIQHRRILTKEDHIARLDRLIWDQRFSAARRQMRRVSQDYQNLAQARLMLMQRTGGVDGAIARVPQALQDDPGLAYERVRWRRRKGFTENAIDLLQAQQGGFVRPEKWWTERRILARRILREGHISEAYRIVKDHGLTDGAKFAEAEWLAGWIALRFLQDRDVALTHFQRFYQAVTYPISRARGAYWTARAAETTLSPGEALEWYQRAAEHITTFYGQLAYARLPNTQKPRLHSAPDTSQQGRQKFESQKIVRIIRMLDQLQQDDLVDAFYEKLIRTPKSAEDWQHTASLATSIGRLDLSIRAAKRALLHDVLLTEAGYPALTIAKGLRPRPALIHSVVRQESAFDDEAISSAGARGLMQLMPATAKQVARQLQVKHTRSRLLSDPKHNLNLGAAYLDSLLKDYDGSLVLAFTAYNAGPHRVSRWIREYGDPRQATLHEAIDWIEQIPFRETRNYVQRVLENLTVYEYRFHSEFSSEVIQQAIIGSDDDKLP